MYSLEISGPLLPGCMYELCHLLKASQIGDFKATFSAHQPSVAFNVPSSKTEGKCTPSGSNLEHSISCGQWKHYQEAEQLKGTFLKELNCKDNLFTWTIWLWTPRVLRENPCPVFIPSLSIAFANNIFKLLENLQSNCTCTTKNKVMKFNNGDLTKNES